MRLILVIAGLFNIGYGYVLASQGEQQCFKFFGLAEAIAAFLPIAWKESACGILWMILGVLFFTLIPLIGARNE
ncbi:MAG: hypothetical protein ACRBC3_18365 [Burkholderiaceae bacterium]